MVGRRPCHAQLATGVGGLQLPAGTEKDLVATAGRLVAGCQEGAMKTTVTWQDVGRPEQPGNYQFTDGMISVGRTKSPFGANILTPCSPS